MDALNSALDRGHCEVLKYATPEDGLEAGNPMSRKAIPILITMLAFWAVSRCEHEKGRPVRLPRDAGIGKAGPIRDAGLDAHTGVSNLGVPSARVNALQADSPVQAMLLKELGTSRGPYFSVAFDPEGKVVLGGTFRAVHVWEVNTGRLVMTYEGHDRHWVLPLAVGSGGVVLSGAGLPGGGFQKVLGSESTLHAWNYNKPGWSRKSMPTAHPKSMSLISSICLTADNRIAIVTDTSPMLYQVHPETLNSRLIHRGRWKGSPENIVYASCSSSGKSVVAAYSRGTLVLLRHEGRKWRTHELPRLPKYKLGSDLVDEWTTALDVVGEADLVIAGGVAGGLMVYDTRDGGKTIVTRRGSVSENGVDRVFSVHSRNQSDIFAAATGKAGVMVYGLKTGKELLRLGEERWGKAYDARFSPDGNHLAAAYHDGRVRLWRINVAVSEPGAKDAPEPSPARPSAPRPATR